MFSEEEIKNIDTNEYHRRENFFLREQIKKLQDEVNLLRHQIKEAVSYTHLTLPTT